MKRWLLPLLLVVSLGVNIGLLLHWAWPRLAGSGSGPRSGWSAGPMRRHLGLSSEQAQRLEAERLQVLARVEPLQQELRGRRRELFTLLKNREPREVELDALLNEIARLQAAIEKVFVLHSLKMRDNFSTEQRRKYEGCLERGLCPGMAAAGSCPPGKMGGRGSGQPGCGDAAEAKK
jgi:Spy/CpxP family protein refolding chaperone